MSGKKKVLYVSDRSVNMDHPQGFCGDNSPNLCYELSQVCNLDIKGWGELSNIDTWDYDIIIAFSSFSGKDGDRIVEMSKHAKIFILDFVDPPLRHVFKEKRQDVIQAAESASGVLCYRPAERGLMNAAFGKSKVVNGPRRVSATKNLGVQRRVSGRDILIYVGMNSDSANLFPITHLSGVIYPLQDRGYCCHLIAGGWGDHLRQLFPKAVVHPAASQIQFFNLLSGMDGVVVPFFLDSSLGVILECACLKVPVWCIPHTGFGEELFPDLVYRCVSDIEPKRQNIHSVLDRAYQKADEFSFESFFERLDKQWGLRLV